MILIDGRIFNLCGKNYTYVLYVNDAGYLQHAYYGEKIDPRDVRFVVEEISARLEPNAGDPNADDRFDIMPSEYGFFAHGDFREPSVVVSRRDGASMSRLRYSSHIVFSGIPETEGLPHARSGGETLSIILKDDFSSAEIMLNYTVYDDSDVLVRNAEIKNVGTEPITIKKAFSFCFDLENGDYELLRLYGNWAEERIPERLPVGRGVTRLQSIRGVSSHQMNPFAVIMAPSCNENDGECFGAELVYSGSFALTAEKTYYGTVRFQGGINDVNFGWRLCEGEKFTTPQTLLCYSGRGLGALSREYSDFLRDRIIDPKFVYKTRPIVVNNWETTSFNFDTETVFGIIDAAADVGADTFVLDDGWFGARYDEKAGLGDWVVNEKKLTGGLGAVIEKCKKRGLKFGLWFEPECVNEDSALFRSHPDWIVGKTDVEPCRHRNQLVLDITRPEVSDYVYSSIAKILRKYDISYVKWDFNRDLTDNYSVSLGDRQGEFAHRYVLSVYRLAERFRSAFPDVFFEGCAGGGGRFDAGMLYYFPQIWTSDNTDARDRAEIQWGTSLAYSLSAMSCHVSDCPNFWTGRSTSLKTRGLIASVGAFGYELDLCKLTDEEKAVVKKQIDKYKRVSDLILYGDLYRIADPFDKKLFCEAVVSKDKRHAYVVGMRLHPDPYKLNQTIKLRGLDDNLIYRVNALNSSVTGKALSAIGLPIPVWKEYEAWAWEIFAEER